MKTLASKLPRERQAAIVEAAERVLPLVLPPDWRAVEAASNATRYKSLDGLRVILEVEDVDGELWLHCSFSRKDRVPSWHDTRRTKDVFIGTTRKAVMVLPSQDEHVNVHPHCLHLYSCLERDVLPDFRERESLQL